MAEGKQKGTKLAKKAHRTHTIGEVENVVLKHIFRALKEDPKGGFRKSVLLDALAQAGIYADDPRLKPTMDALNKYKESQSISEHDFVLIVKHNIVMIEKALTGNLIIPDFEGFCADIEEIYKKTLRNKSGHVADYIPQLGRVDPEHYAIAITTVDGQRYSIGEADTYFALQSTCKPLLYCMALEEHGEEKVHKYIGREPSGRGFNELTLNHEGLPHNPMINSGAIMSSSLIRQDLDIADRFDYVMKYYEKLGGDQPAKFNNPMYLSELKTADRNFALGYFIKEKNAFPTGTDLIEVLEFYFQCCSVELTCKAMSSIAASLANAGICPVTNKRVFSGGTVKNCLALMESCGMYDFSGEFAFSVGVPAKSGVSGALMIVIPNVMGIEVWSPRLDALGNTVRGIEFCKELIARFNFHKYDSLIRFEKKRDPRLKKSAHVLEEVVSFCWAASQGDLSEVKRYVALGIDIDESDYDGRTAIHLASSEGHVNVIEYLIQRKVNVNPVDRWGNTPLDDTVRHKHKAAVDILKKHGGKAGKHI